MRERSFGLRQMWQKRRVSLAPALAVLIVAAFLVDFLCETGESSGEGGVAGGESNYLMSK